MKSWEVCKLERSKEYPPFAWTDSKLAPALPFDDNFGSWKESSFLNGHPYSLGKWEDHFGL